MWDIDSVAVKVFDVVVSVFAEEGVKFEEGKQQSEFMSTDL